MRSATHTSGEAPLTRRVAAHGHVGARHASTQQVGDDEVGRTAVAETARVEANTSSCTAPSGRSDGAHVDQLPPVVL